MELRWLEDFIALAKTRHFSRAADDRNVTQPTLSRRIKLLEDEMGVTLIDRNSLPLSLTPAGEVFLAGAEQISRIARETKARCGEIREQEANQLIFATTQTLYLSLYKSWLLPLSGEHGIDIDLNLKSTAWVGTDFVNALAQGECDLVLCFWHPVIDFIHTLDDDRYEHLVIGNEMLVPVTAVDDAGMPMYQLPGERKDPLPYIGYNDRSFLRPVIQQMLSQQLEQPQLVTMNENVHSVSVKAMIKEGFGLGWVPQRLVADNLKYNRLALAGDEQWNIPLQIRLYRLRDNTNSQLLALWTVLADTLSRGQIPALSTE
ncbi:LysR family transcriptional regulator [Pontibacterium granulatum]|uniref:LysR family transcriptional regulator n=1 Tax=Pontibacterium granulatum TaxID=2036029 RepID=UPI00249A2DA5|nr:LysR family transcriptional regulator [Pontibacterium granulatum]MDI3323245.1 LysR family transcriptional regulator [Pontibacterium granulatum]